MRKLLILRNSLFIGLVFLLIASTNEVNAGGGVTWNGSEGTDWNNIDNWSGNPSGKDVTINDVANDPIISTDSDFDIKKLKIDGGLLTMTDGILNTQKAEFKNSGIFNMEGGTLNIIHPTDQFEWKNSATVNATGGTVVFKSSGRPTKCIFAGDQFYNIEIDIGKDPLFDDINGNAIKVSGNFTNNNTTLDNSTNATFTFNGTGDQNITGTSSGNTFGDLEVDKPGGTLSISNAISTAGDFTMTAGIFDPGANQLTIGGTFAAFDAGTIKVGASTFGLNYSKNPSSPLSSGTTVDYNAAGAQTVSNSFSYSNFSISGSGTKTLAGNTTASGILTVKAESTLALSTFNLGSPSSVELECGAYGSTISGTGTLSLGGPVNVTYVATGTTRALISSPIALGATRVFTVPESQAFNGLRVTGVISGTSFGLTKAGIGRMVLVGTNTYTGTTTVLEGALRIRNDQGAGTTAGGVIVSDGAVLQLQGGITVGAEALSLGGDGPNGVALVTNIGGDNNWGGTVTLTADAEIISFSGTLAISNALAVDLGAFDLTLKGDLVDGLISGEIKGSGTVTKMGSGTWILSGSNTYTGATLVQAGILKAGSTQAFGLASAVTLNNTAGVVLDITGFNNTIGSLTGGGATGGNVTLGAATLTIGSDNTSPAAYSGIIGGTGSLIKSGTGILILSGANTYTGTTTVNAGTLQYGIDNALSNGAVAVDGGTFDIATYSDAVGAVTLTNGTIAGTTGVLTGTSYAMQNGSVSAILAGAIPLSKTTTGTVTLSGANTFTGGTQLSAGTLNINNSQALGTVAGSFTISGGTIDNTSGGAITTLNYPQTWNSDITFTGTNDLNLGAGTVTIGASRQVTVSANTLTVGGAISAAAFDLTKAGAGILGFGSNTVSFDGLSISAGTLASTSGTMNLVGDFTNNATFTHNSGTVVLNGTAAQAIGGSNASTFNDLTVDNNAAGVTLSHPDDIATTVSGTLLINSGELLTIDANKRLTVTGTLTNSAGNSGLVIKSTAAGTGSLIHSTASVDGTVERYLALEDWHYIAAPIAYSGTDYFSTLTPGLGLTAGAGNDQFYYWQETNNTWHDILNGEDGTGSDPLMDELGFNLAQGYAIRYASSSVTLSLNGALNEASQSIGVTMTGNELGFNGSNLVGNPFTSTIAANSGADASNNFLDDNSANLQSGYVAVYLWDDIHNDYATINNVESEPGTYIAPGQGFMIMAGSNTNVTFNTATRKHGSATFYKASGNESSIFELMITNPHEATNTTKIAFVPGMTNGLDESYDGGKLFGNANLGLYTKLVEDNGTAFAIQALPPVFDQTTVKLGVKAEIAGEYTFEPTMFQNWDEYTSVFLEDKQTGMIVDLTTEPGYTFTINNTGDIDNRFELHFKSVVGINDPIIAPREETIRAYVSNNTLYIVDEGSIEGVLAIFNMLGQQVMWQNYNSEFNTPINLNLTTGYYIVRLVTEDNVVSNKIHVK